MTKHWNPIAAEDTWTISERGLQYIQNTQAAIDKSIASGQYKAAESNELEEEKPYYTLGTSALVRIKGPLVNSDSFWNELFGLTSYNSIQLALLAAVEDPNIDRIILDVDSPGGSVSGVTATADLIYAIDKSVKPVFAVTDGSMASGAYWLASGAREIYASELSSIGSIGVITTHFEQTARLEKEGIKATVIRSGKYKQLGNSNEPLTEEGRLEIQGQLDRVYSVFVDHVSETRDKSYEYTDKFMAQGRVFMGETAKEVGLVDNILSFQAAIVAISEKTVDTTKFPYKIAT